MVLAIPIAVGLGGTPVADSVVSILLLLRCLLGLVLHLLLGLRLLRFFHAISATASLGGHLLGSGGCCGGRLFCLHDGLEPVPGHLAGVDVVVVGPAGVGIENFLPSRREGRGARVGSGRGILHILLGLFLDGGGRGLLVVGLGRFVCRGDLLLLRLLRLLRAGGGLASIILLRLLSTVLRLAALTTTALLRLLLLMLVVSGIITLLRLSPLLLPRMPQLLRGTPTILRLSARSTSVRRRRRRHGDRRRQEDQSVPLELHSCLANKYLTENGLDWRGLNLYVCVPMFCNLKSRTLQQKQNRHKM